MPFNKTIKREIEVAFSKRSQPVWFRVLKYIALTFIVYFFGEANYFGLFYSFCSFFPCCYIFGTGTKLMGGQKVMVCGSMTKAKRMKK